MELDQCPYARFFSFRTEDLLTTLFLSQQYLDMVVLSVLNQSSLLNPAFHLYQTS